MFNIYVLILVLVALERIFEIFLSKKHERVLKSLGAVEHGQEHFLAMKVMHTLFLVSCLAEAYFKETPPSEMQFAAFTALAILTQVLRYWVITTLGSRWTINVMVLPNAPLITHGPFRWIRHPNYLAVVIEIIALPMIFNSFITAITFTILNSVVLFVRIRAEEKALGG
jgi:methyltransferase